MLEYPPPSHPPSSTYLNEERLHRPSQLRDVRRELQDVLHERDVEAARAARVDDLEETVSELRRQNKELEDQVCMCTRAPWGACSYLVVRDYVFLGRSL